jgi:hypothetical protein
MSVQQNSENKSNKRTKSVQKSRNASKSKKQEVNRSVDKRENGAISINICDIHTNDENIDDDSIE